MGTTHMEESTIAAGAPASVGNLDEQGHTLEHTNTNASEDRSNSALGTSSGAPTANGYMSGTTNGNDTDLHNGQSGTNGHPEEDPYVPDMQNVCQGDLIRHTRRTNASGVQAEDLKICVVMVGLPARGKSYIAQKRTWKFHIAFFSLRF